VTILLAVAAAVGWGASDYFGGDASRGDTPVLVVVAGAELIGAVLLVPVLIARGAPPPDVSSLLLAALAGLAVTVELRLIYRALSAGQAFITAPTGALGTAAAVAVGLVSGDRLDLALGIGLACALAGAGLSAWTSPAPAAAPRSASARRRAAGRAALVCAGAAAAVATMLTALHAAGRLDPVWATLTEHAGTALSAGLAALAATGRRPRSLLPARAQLRGLGVIAAVGVGGDLAYATASHGGALSIVAAVSSLYPITTIALARLLRGQRATPIQLAGIALALGGAALLGAAAP